MSDNLQHVTRVQIHGDDAVVTGHMVVAGFFAMWLLDELYTPEYLENYRNNIRPLKEAVTPEAAMRVMQTFARTHPQAQRLLAAIEDMKALPW